MSPLTKEHFLLRLNDERMSLCDAKVWIKRISWAMPLGRRHLADVRLSGDFLNEATWELARWVYAN